MTHTINVILNLTKLANHFNFAYFPKIYKNIGKREINLSIYIYHLRNKTPPWNGSLIAKVGSFFDTKSCSCYNQSRVIGLSIHSFSAAILPEPRPVILPKELTADNPLKLLLPSLKFRDLLIFRSFEEWRSESASSSFVTLIACNCTMLLLQNGHTGSGGLVVVGFGLLWQHKASTQCAHIWCPQSWTSIVHN